MKYTLFADTETTGLPNFRKAIDDPSQPHIVQLAAVLEDENRQVVCALNTLIMPESDWEMNPAAEAVHGISLDRAFEAGISHENVLGAFYDLSNSADLLVCHNIKFDAVCIEAASRRALGYSTLDKETNTYCTMLGSMNLVKARHKNGKSIKWPKLEECYWHFFNEPMENAHDAMSDVMACRRVYHYLQDNGHVQ